MSKQFASVADLEVKKTTFEQLSAHCWAYTAEGDPNTGVIIGDDAVLICDALATPVMAQNLIAEIRKVTDKPIKYVVLSLPRRARARRVRLPGRGHAGNHRQPGHLRDDRRAWPAGHDVRVRALPAPVPEFRVDSRPDLADPGLQGRNDPVDGQGSGSEGHARRPGHTKGDTIVWVPSEKVLSPAIWSKPTPPATPATPELEEWPATLDALSALGADKVVPGRGPALIGPARVAEGLATPRLRHHAAQFRQRKPSLRA